MNALGLVLFSALLVLLIVTWLVLYQVIRQQGRMLLRIDELAGAVGRTDGARANVPVGPPVGSAIEAFTVSDLDGRQIGLEKFAGRKVVLVNWSPTCGYCDRIAPDLAARRPDLERANAALVLLAHGDAEANRASAEKFGLTDAVFLLGDDANPGGFRALGTPSALLLDEEARVAAPLAVGANKVPELIEQVVERPTGSNGEGRRRLRGERSLDQSRLVRDGLKAGTPAPSFVLPGLDGNPVSLEEYRGRQVLLAFSDPHCGPCDALAPHLVDAHRREQHGGPAVILVSRGDVADNRRKAEEHGFEFPLVVQEGWKLSKEYGIFSTPVAFLIDEQGRIARDVAKGVADIVSLIPAGSGAYGGNGG